MLERVVLGLDLGSYSVKAVELRAGLRSVEFVRCEEARIPRDAGQEEREATIQLFLEQTDLPREFIVSALASDRVTQRHLRFPFTAPKRVQQAIPFELEENLPFPLESIVLTHEQVLAQPDASDVLVVMAPRSELEAFLSATQRMDFDPRILDVEGAVLANLCSHLKLSGVGRLVVDIGHRKTNVCVLVDGKPISLRSIPLGGHHLTETIAKDLQLAYDAAEEHKHENGLFEPGSSKAISPGVRNVLERLAREIKRSLQAVVNDPLATIAPAEILLTGGSAQAENLAIFLEESTGMPCSVLSVSGAEEGTEALAAAGPLVFSQAAALALRGSITARTTQLDLRKDDFSYTPDLSGLRSQLRLAVGLFALCLLLWPVALWSKLSARQSEADALVAQLESVCSQTFPVANCAGEPFETLEKELRSTRQLADHLGVTGNGLSALEVMRQLSQRVAANLDVSLTELKIERKSISTRGRSLDSRSAEQMRTMLAGYEWFEDVRLTDVQTNPRGGGKTFSLTIKLREDL